jgi:signal transduction histidine kinase
MAGMHNTARGRAGLDTGREMIDMRSDATGAQKVLIIDDSKSLRQYVEGLLTEAGYEVHSAPDGKVGLQLISDTQPDVVLLDIEMPVLDGREVLAALSPAGRLLSIVVLTSKSAMKDRLSLFGIGADDFMAKPFNDDELLARVRAAARTAQLKRELAASRDQALDLLHKFESSQKSLAEERELTAISKLISGIADKMNSPIGYVRSNIGTIFRYSDVLIELCERLAALQARKGMTAEEIKQALNDEVKWMKQAKVDNIRQYLGPLAKETVQGIDRISSIVAKLVQIDLASGCLEKRPENIVGVVRGLAEKMRERVSGITLSVEAERESFMVECNKTRIGSALENIMENAVESVNGTGWILIRLYGAGDEVVIEINDTGAGIPGNKLDAVFDPFVSCNTRSGKVGLGLTVARYLINANKGKISISSDEGKGAQVKVALPLAGVNTPLGATIS